MGDVAAGAAGHEDLHARLAVLFEQQRAHAAPRQLVCQRGADQPAADDQHIRLGEDGDLASRLQKRFRRPRSPVRRPDPAEGLQPLLGADTAAVVAHRLGPIPKNLGLEEDAVVVAAALAVRHAFLASNDLFGLSFLGFRSDAPRSPPRLP